MSDCLPDAYVLCIVTSPDGDCNETALFLHKSKDDRGCIFRDSKDIPYDGPTHNTHPEGSAGHAFVSWVSFGPEHLDMICRKNAVVKQRPFKDSQSWCMAVMKALVKAGDLRKKDFEAAIKPLPRPAVRT